MGKVTDAAKTLHKRYIEGKTVPAKMVLECEHEIANLEHKLYDSQEGEKRLRLEINNIRGLCNDHTVLSVVKEHIDNLNALLDKEDK